MNIIIYYELFCYYLLYLYIYLLDK